MIAKPKERLIVLIHWVVGTIIMYYMDILLTNDYTDAQKFFIWIVFTLLTIVVLLKQPQQRTAQQPEIALEQQ